MKLSSMLVKGNTPGGKTLDQLPDGNELPTLVNVPLALVPNVVTAVMHTTMMRASMTAYSTAVGPSSALTNLMTFLVNLRMGSLPGKMRMTSMDSLPTGKTPRSDIKAYVGTGGTQLIIRAAGQSRGTA